MTLKATFDLIENFLQIFLRQGEGFPPNNKPFFNGWFGNNMEMDMFYFLV
jgi:hypothetical protein